MRAKYSLKCTNANKDVTSFLLFDRGLSGFLCNCGHVRIPTEDLYTFLRRNWEGNIDWNGQCPFDELESQREKEENSPKAGSVEFAQGTAEKDLTQEVQA